jgi:predicted ATP-dependent serine protease
MEIMRALADHGPEGAAVALGVPRDQIKNLVSLGNHRTEPPSPSEYRLSVAQLVLENENLNQLPLDKKLSLLGALNQFANDDDQGMVAEEEVDLGAVVKPVPIEKWQSGFGPLDIVTGGVYQALVILMAKPGTGKTSTMLSMAEGIKRRHPEIRTLFFQEEIPARLIAGRMAPIFERGNPFKEGDRIYAGGHSIEEIEALVNKQPDSNQIVFVDSPDAMTVSRIDARHEALEYIYRRLAKIKQKARLVVVASQPRRKDAQLEQASVAESWAKAWFADIIIGLSAVGYKKMKFSVLKNRFGQGGSEVKFEYDLETLAWNDPLDEGGNSDW